MNDYEGLRMLLCATAGAGLFLWWLSSYLQGQRSELALRLVQGAGVLYVLYFLARVLG